ncbi:hypothetical protein GCM10009682_47790 [Luedemannella flava]|uniref:HEAT repeat domain-containing protein n=2 Tax=Luedemannella flava TaxID=349316 RepID=A0ABP4YKW9_9ACTN
MEERFAAAVAAARAVATLEEYGRLIEDLRDAAGAGPEALRVGAAATRDADPVVRKTACDLLGAVANQHPALRADAATAVLALEPTEIHPDVLWAMVRALGQTGDRRAVPLLVELARHDDADVRYMVASMLPWVRDDDDADGLAALLRLCRDNEVGVREWATYGLGQLTSADGAMVRDLLWEATTDEDEDVRAEGARGLARRRDHRALPLVAELLQTPEYDVFNQLAAGYLGEASLVPLLLAYAPDEQSAAEALRECDPVRRAARDAFAADLFDALSADRTGVALYGTRCETGLTLAVGDRTWSVEDLLDDTGGDPAEAARRVTADLTA